MIRQSRVRAPWLLGWLLAFGLACGPGQCGNPVPEGSPPGRAASAASERRRAVEWASGRSSKPEAPAAPDTVTNARRLERAPGEDAAYPPMRGRVVKVVDGDTIHVRLEGRGREKVRYIGIDTPETKHPRLGVQPFGPEASRLNRELVGGRAVRLVFDRALRDRYGRLLAYVFREEDDLFVNAELVRRGLARALRVRPNVRYAETFERLEREARAARRGMWAVAEQRPKE